MKKVSTSRDSFCPLLIFISLDLEVASRVMSHCLFFVSLMKIRGCLILKVSIHSSKFPLYFVVPERIIKL